MVMPPSLPEAAETLFARLSPKRAMTVMAHPDDNEFMCGGTVALLASLGWEVDIVVATSGNKGTKDPTVTPQYLAGVREDEQRAAAAILGAREPVYLGFPDGGIHNDDELRGLLVRLLRLRRPTLAITWDGFRPGFNHRDHRRVGRALYDAIYPAADDHLYYPLDKEEGLEPHRPEVLLLGAADQPDFQVNIEAVLETKIDAVFAHTSQMGARTREEMLRFWRERAAAQQVAVPSGSNQPDASRQGPSGRDGVLTESFRKVDFGAFPQQRARDHRPAAGRGRRGR